MTDQDLTITLRVEASPDNVVAAVCDVPSWWSGTIEGPADRVGAEFTYRYGDLHRSTQRVTELVPGSRVVWHVVDADMPPVHPPDEWTGTDIVFDLREVDGGTELRFTHVGLTPSLDCWDRCRSGWTALVGGNLATRITTGEPQADAFASRA